MVPKFMHFTVCDFLCDEFSENNQDFVEIPCSAQKFSQANANRGIPRIEFGRLADGLSGTKHILEMEQKLAANPMERVSIGDVRGEVAHNGEGFVPPALSVQQVGKMAVECGRARAKLDGSAIRLFGVRKVIGSSENLAQEVISAG